MPKVQNGRRVAPGLIAVLFFVGVLTIVVFGPRALRQSTEGLFCKLYVNETQPSPNGERVAERQTVDCGDEPQQFFALRRPGERSVIRSALSVNIAADYSWLFQWVDDRHLLVGVTGRDRVIDFARKPVIDGVAIEYSILSNDPSTPRGKRPRSTSKTDVEFIYRFETQRDVTGPPSVDCTISLTTSAARTSPNLLLRLSAGKQLRQSAWSSNGIVHFPERSSASLLVAKVEDYTTPSDFATAASLDAMPPAQHLQRDFNLHAIHAPSGGLAPKWSISRNLSQQDVDSVIAKLETNQFTAQLGFWLSDTEQTIVSAGRVDAKVVESFRSCLADNKIFHDSAD